MPVFEVIKVGAGLSIQDEGRTGWRRYGVPLGGTMDAYAAKWANRLVGNPDNAPVLEVALHGAQLRVVGNTWVAVAGANLGAVVSPWSAGPLTAGALLDFKRNRSGMWAYLAVPGGFEVPRWLGSASVDARNGLGQPLGAGDVLHAGGRKSCGIDDRVGRRELIPAIQRNYLKPPTFTLLKGPEFAQFDREAARLLVESTWRVSSRSDRTGFRLEGPALPVPPSIRSGPVLPGSFQIPGNGQPIVTMRDGPTVGGYAKLAVFKESELDWFAQCRPGSLVSFRWNESL